MSHQRNDDSERRVQWEMASDYDVISVQMGKIREGGVVLNIGVGIGVFASYVTRVWNTFTIGVDISKKALEATKRRVEETGVKRRVFLLLASTSHLPLRGEDVDTGVSMFTMRGLTQEGVLEVFQEIRRVLKKNGKYVLVEDWAFHPKRQEEYALLELRRMLAKREETGEYCLNYREYTKILKHAGFEIEEIRFLPNRVFLETFDILQGERAEDLLQIVGKVGLSQLQTPLTLIGSKVKR